MKLLEVRTKRPIYFALVSSKVKTEMVIIRSHSQIGRAGVEVQVQCLSADGDRGQIL